MTMKSRRVLDRRAFLERRGAGGGSGRRDVARAAVRGACVACGACALSAAPACSRARGTSMTCAATGRRTRMRSAYGDRRTGAAARRSRALRR